MMKSRASEALRRAGADAVEQLEGRLMMSAAPAVSAFASSHEKHVRHVQHVRHMNQISRLATPEAARSPFAMFSAASPLAGPSVATPASADLPVGAAPIPAAAPAPAIGVNFSGGGNNGAPAVNMAAGDVAGVVPRANYNNFNGNTGNGILKDNAGSTTSANLSYTGGGNYSAVGGTPVFGDANERLNDGFMYGNGNISLSSLPYSHFDVYVYQLNDGPGRVQTTSSSSGQTYYGISATPNDSNHIDGNAGTAYVYTQATSTDPGAPTPAADYVLFADQAGDSFGFNTSAPGNGYLNGFQVVADPWQGDALPAPSNLNAVAGPGTVNLTWDRSQNAFSYTVYRKGPTDPAPVALATGLTSASYSDTTAVNNTTYSYTVTAENVVSHDSGGNLLPAPVTQSSPQSSPVNATPTLSVPATPTGVVASNNGTNVTVSWAAVPFGTSYTVKRGTFPGGALTTVGTNVATNSFTEPTSGLTKGQAYYYVVSTTNAGGTSPNSAPVVLGTGDGWTASYYRNQEAGSGDVNNPVVTATPSGYDFQRIDPTINFTGNTTTPVANKPAYFNTDQPETATSTARGDDFSARWDGFIQAQYSEQYTLYHASDDGSQVFIEDPANPGTFVNLDKTNNIQSGGGPITLHSGRGITEDALNVTTADGTPFAFVAGQKYHVVVEFAQGGGGWDSVFRWSSPSTPKQIIPQGQTYAIIPDKVTGPSQLNANPSVILGDPVAIGNNQSVNLTWNIDGATSYNLYRSTTPGGEGATPYKTGLTATTYNDTGLTNGTTYYYQITGVDLAGEGARSTEVSAVSTPQPPVAPVGVTESASLQANGKPQVAVSWTAVPFADSYIVQRAFETAPGSGTAGAFTTVTGAGAVVGTSFTDTDASLALGKLTFYRVISHNNGATNDPNGTGVGNSPPANVTATDLVQGGINHVYQPTWWKSAQNNTNGYVAPNSGVSLAADATTILKTVNLTAGDPAPGINNNTFSAVVTGKIHITTDGTYTFPTQTDDDGYLYVGGTLVSADPGGHGLRQPATKNSIFLKGGQDYNFQLFMTNTGGGWGYQLRYQGPDSADVDVIIPQSALRVLSGAPTAATNLSTDSPFLNQDGSTYSVPVRFNDVATSELQYILQRSTTANFAAGTVSNVTTQGVFDNGQTDGSTGATGSQSVTIVDKAAPAGQTLFYRLVAVNFDGSTTSATTTSATTGAATVQFGAEGHYYANQWWRSGDQSTAGPVTRGPNSQNGITPLSGDTNGQVGDINADGGDTSGPADGIPGTNFSTVFTGTVTINTAGDYRFSAETDDDSYLFIDGKLASQDPGGHGLRVPGTINTLNLTAGPHTFVLFQSQGGGGWGYHMYYTGADTGDTKTLVPNSALSTLSATPTTLTTFAGASPSATQIKLTWDLSPSAVRYVIQRSAKAFTDPTLVEADITTSSVGIGATSYTDSVNPNQTFYYRVRAENYDGASAFTAAVQVTSQNKLPTPVLTAKQGDAGVDLTFTNVSNGNPNLVVTGYQILRSTDGITFTPVTVVPSTQLSYFDSTGPAGGFVVGQTYYYQVVAQGTPANSDASAIGQVKYQTVTTVPKIDHSTGFGFNSGLLSNGSFEGPTVGPNSFNYQTQNGGAPTLFNNWTYSGATGLLSGNAGGFGGPGGVVGSQYAFVQTNGGDPRNVTGSNYIQQTFNVTTAGAYTLGLFDAVRGTNTPTYDVIVDYTGPGTGTVVYSGAPTLATFTQRQIALGNLTAGSHTITILSTNTAGDNSAYFDAVRVLPTAGYTPLVPVNDIQLNGSAGVPNDDGRLRLTSGLGGQTGSAYTKIATSVGNGFTTTFDFQITAPGADGFAFVLQEAGPTNLGGNGNGGGGLGYVGTPGNSVAVFFNQYNNVTQTGLGLNGVRGTSVDMTTLGNAFHPAGSTTSVFTVTLSYDKTTKVLTELVKDQTTNQTYSATYNIDLAAALNDNYAYVGFSGATGGVASTQDIINWNFQPTAIVQPAPTLVSTVIGDGTAARFSNVRNITLTFDHAVTVPLSAVKLSLLNTGGSGTNNGAAPTDASAALGTPTTSDGGLTWIVPIVSSAFTDVGTSGSLRDGVYTVTVDATQVKDAANTALTGTNLSTTFHRIFGDFNGDKTVSASDYTRFSQRYSGSQPYNAAYDFENNGTISASDYTRFSQRYSVAKTYVY